MILGFARGILVVIEKKVIHTLLIHGQTGRDAAEVGGVLIGNYRGPHVEVIECTTPMPGDVCLRYMFDRKDPGHERAVRDAWRQSHHTQTFVGEWHTHPEDHPSPSWLDRRTWNNVMRTHRDGPVLFLIVGRRGFWVGLGNLGTLLPATLIDVERGETGDLSTTGKNDLPI